MGRDRIGQLFPLSHCLAMYNRILLPSLLCVSLLLLSAGNMSRADENLMSILDQDLRGHIEQSLYANRHNTRCPCCGSCPINVASPRDFLEIKSIDNFDLWYQAAKAGIPEGQILLATCYAFGIGVPENRAEMIKWYYKAAEQGQFYAQHRLGVCYLNGRGVTQNHVESMRWFRKSAEQGFDQAQRYVGMNYLRGRGVPINHVEALRWFRKSAAQGNASGQHEVGFAYFHGRGVPMDRVEAAKWIRKAAEQGMRLSQRELGLCYLRGNGVEPDIVEAIKWLLKAASRGDLRAQLELAKIYLDGVGTYEDMEEAIRWLQSAAEGGHTGAQAMLADLERWLAENGCAEMQYKLAMRILNGDDAVRNMEEAINWLRRAAEQGHQEARNLLAQHLGESLEQPENQTAMQQLSGDVDELPAGGFAESVTTTQTQFTTNHFNTNHFNETGNFDETSNNIGIGRTGTGVPVTMDELMQSSNQVADATNWNDTNWNDDDTTWYATFCASSMVLSLFEMWLEENYYFIEQLANEDPELCETSMVLLLFEMWLWENHYFVWYQMDEVTEALVLLFFAMWLSENYYSVEH